MGRQLADAGRFGGRDRQEGETAERLSILTRHPFVAGAFMTAGLAVYLFNR